MSVNTRLQRKRSSTPVEDNFFLAEAIHLVEEGIVKTEGKGKPPGLLQVMRERMRLAHMSMFTEKTYVQWVKRFIYFHGKRHPREMGAKEITQFLSYAASEKHVSAATQNQALNSIVFLYKHVLEQDPGKFEGIIRARRPRFIPEVLSVEETKLLLEQLEGVHKSPLDSVTSDLKQPEKKPTATRQIKKKTPNNSLKHRLLKLPSRFII